jgi:hypothetical protein
MTINDVNRTTVYPMVIEKPGIVPYGHNEIMKEITKKIYIEKLNAKLKEIDALKALSMDLINIISEYTGQFPLTMITVPKDFLVEQWNQQMKLFLEPHEPTFIIGTTDSTAFGRRFKKISLTDEESV